MMGVQNPSLAKVGGAAHPFAPLDVRPLFRTGPNFRTQIPDRTQFPDQILTSLIPLCVQAEPDYVVRGPGA